MQLSVSERLTLLGTLPREGDITSIRIIRQLKDALSLNELEHVQMGITNDPVNGTITWKQNIDKEVEIGPKALTVIIKALEDLNQQKKLTEYHIPLYERFVEDKPLDNDKVTPIKDKVCKKSSPKEQT